MAKETERAEAAAQLERRMSAMEAVLAARRTPVAEAKPEAARGPGADLRFQVSSPQPACRCILHLALLPLDGLRGWYVGRKSQLAAVAATDSVCSPGTV